MKKFEYCCIDETINTARLNNLGAEGWQLMLFKDGVMLFMREIEEVRQPKPSYVKQREKTSHA